MSVGAIVDTRIKLRPSKKLLKFVHEHNDAFVEIPVNFAKVLKENGYKLADKTEIPSDECVQNPIKIDTKLLGELCKKDDAEKPTDDDKENVESEAEKNTETFKSDKEKQENDKSLGEGFLYLTDLYWLNVLLGKLRKEKNIDIFLHNLIESCSLELPANEIIERNPELEKRCQRLREDQENREYQKMTKNVDATLKNYPEDTIAYQMKSINSQMIAVLQFVTSVIAGFVFGFLGVQLIVGNLEFGFRLLLGIMCALIIALAEIYFLAKKLNEYDDTSVPLINGRPSGLSSPSKSKKPHQD